MINMNFIILGSVGSGKGTQAKLLAEKLGLVHLSSGALLRQAAKENSEQGRKISQLLTSGKLLPLDLNTKLLFPRLKQAFSTGFILDGFPRDMDQTKALEDFLKQENQVVDKAIFLEISDEVSLERLLKRAKTENRSDDKIPAIKQRIQVFHQLVIPVIEHYRQQGKLLTIDGTPDIETIHKDILSKLSPQS